MCSRTDPAEVLAAIERIAAGVLADLQPGEKRAGVLERFGLGLAGVTAKRLHGGPIFRRSNHLKSLV